MDLDSLLASAAVVDERNAWSAKFERVLSRCWGVVDDLQRVAQDPDGRESDLRDAVLAARGQIVEILRLEDAVPFGELGDPIDLRRHIVKAIEPGQGGEAQILAIMRHGLEWNYRVIKKAEVVASKAQSIDDTGGEIA